MQVTTDGATLVLDGAFDARSTLQVRSALYDLLAEHRDVRVDLAGVDAADLTALKVLAAASRQAAHDGGHVRLLGAAPSVRRLLAVSHLRRLVDVEPVPA